MIETTYEKLDKEDKRVLDAAENVMKTAYNPYSKFYVGAALLSEDGRVFAGSNVENAAYGSTICAERAAILYANAKDVRKFSKLAIIDKGEDFDNNNITGPCGSCRQMLYELTAISGKDLEVILSTTNKDKIIKTTITELLPLPFGPRELNVDIKKYQ